MQKKGRYNIRSIERGLLILRELSGGDPRKLSDLSSVLGLSESTTFRHLSTLCDFDYVERDLNLGGYRLGPACIELAQSYYEGNDLRRVAISELETLRDTTTETVHLGILNRMEVVYLEKLHGLHAIGLMSSHVGGRSPAYCTGLGKVLLAFSDLTTVRSYFDSNGLTKFTERTITNVNKLLRHLKQVKQGGYALDNGEHEPEVRCVAAPIFDFRGEIVAAISVSGPAARLDPLNEKQELISMTIDTARRISQKLGYSDQLI